MTQKQLSESKFKEAYQIFSTKFSTVLTSAVCFYIPLYIVYLIAYGFIYANYNYDINYMGLNIPLLPIVQVGLAIVLNMIFSPVFNASMYILSDKVLKKESFKIKDIILDSIRLSGKLIGTSFIYILIVIISPLLLGLVCLLLNSLLANYFVILQFINTAITMLCFVLIAFSSTVFYFNTFVICEGVTNLKDIFTVSYKSVREKWGTTFIIITAILMLQSFLKRIVFNLVGISTLLDNAVLFMCYNIASILLAGYFSIFLSLWYKDKLKNIGFDKDVYKDK